MKTSLLLETIRMNQGEVIADWGQARLIRHLDGRYQLVGGTAEDQAVVREWISLFGHDIVLAHEPARRPPRFDPQNAHAVADARQRAMRSAPCRPTELPPIAHRATEEMAHIEPSGTCDLVTPPPDGYRQEMRGNIIFAVHPDPSMPTLYFSFAAWCSGWHVYHGP